MKWLTWINNMDDIRQKCFYDLAIKKMVGMD